MNGIATQSPTRKEECIAIAFQIASPKPGQLTKTYMRSSSAVVR